VVWGGELREKCGQGRGTLGVRLPTRRLGRRHESWLSRGWKELSFSEPLFDKAGNVGGLDTLRHGREDLVFGRLGEEQGEHPCRLSCPRHPE